MIIHQQAQEMSPDLPKHVHRALKLWHKRHTHTMLDGFLCTHQIQINQHIDNPHLIINQVLIDGLDRLKRFNAEAANLLQRRFPNNETAREIAYSLNTSPDTIYQRQRVAIVQLARAIWGLETEIREQHAQHIKSRLPTPTYTKLFGVQEKVIEIREQLAGQSAPWILSLEGMGGIGKTALADALARHLAYDVYFRNIAWISTPHCIFHLNGETEISPPMPGLTIETLIDQLIDQFELADLRRASEIERLIGIQDYLKQQPSLIIIDDLGAVADFHTLIGHLRELANPSKFLITTRTSLRGESGVYILQMEGLSPQNTFALIRHEAASQGLTALANAPDTLLQPIYDLTEGNPLATKLIIGQVHTFPLPDVLERLRTVKGVPATNLLDFIYADAWQALDQRCRTILKAMLLVPDCGGDIEHIAQVSGLSPSETAVGLQHLVTHTLVITKGGLKKRSYVLHQLTQNFVQHKVAEEDKKLSSEIINNDPDDSLHREASGK